MFPIISESHPGTCPVVEGGFGTCVEACHSDFECGDKNLKCCSNGCGHTCVNAIPGIARYYILYVYYLQYVTWSLIELALKYKINMIYNFIVSLLYFLSDAINIIET